MNPFVKIMSAHFVFGLKAVSKSLFRTRARWITPKEEIHWEELRLAVILNHTSLFEPLFISAIPNLRLWRGINRVVVPVADVTMKRPFLGRFFKLCAPNCVPITRKRDDSWNELLSRVAGDSIILIFPEGRMKRTDGLDKHGQPMSIKGGIADILDKIEDGKMLVAYSGGLHHVQAPGQKVPKLFKTIQISFEEIDIPGYKKKLATPDHKEFRQKVIDDLQGRMDLYC